MNRATFEIHYERFAPYVNAILIARLPPAQVEDTLQDVFLEAWRKIHQLQSESSFGPWIAAIARHKTTDYFRHRRPTEDLNDNQRDTRIAPPAHVLEALQHLPEAYRETLALRFVEGLTGPEIAELTGLTHGSVRVNLSRGIAQLRQLLGVKIDA